MQVPAALYGSQLRTHPYLLDHHDISLESYGSGYTGESPVSWTHSPTHPGYEALESQTGLPAQVHVDKFPPRLGPDGGRAPGFKVQPYQVQVISVSSPNSHRWRVRRMVTLSARMKGTSVGLSCVPE